MFKGHSLWGFQNIKDLDETSIMLDMLEKNGGKVSEGDFV